MPKIVKGFAAQAATRPLEPFQFSRRDLRAGDIQIEILYCGVCHSDLHTVRNEWKNTQYPVVPGHEIVGRVVAVGKEVKGFKVGDLTAVGCLVDACRSCPHCAKGEEQYCNNGFVLTYNGIDKQDKSITYGGYSTEIIVDEKFAFHVPKAFKKEDLPAVAPLLCAGITTYSPLRHWNVTRGKKVGIVGLGGLGHMGLKLAHAMGAEVVLFTTSPGKAADGKRLGADEVVVSKDSQAMKKHQNSFDFILNTVSAAHNLDPFIELLKVDGTMCMVGIPEKSHPSFDFTHLTYRRKSLSGSLIGGTKETQEMLNFCAEKGIVSDIELIPIQKVNEAYERLLKSDVKYRFVIDNASLKG